MAAATIFLSSPGERKSSSILSLKHLRNKALLDNERERRPAFELTSQAFYNNTSSLRPFSPMAFFVVLLAHSVKKTVRTGEQLRRKEGRRRHF